MSGVGGYMRRSERMQPQPDPTWSLTHCGHCGANMKFSAYPHFCKEIFYQSMPILRFEPFEVRDE